MVSKSTSTVTRSDHAGTPASHGAPTDGEGHAHTGVWGGIERTVLVALTTLVSINLWTGGPLFAMWVGSRIQAAAGQLSMGAVVATVGVLIVVSLILYRVLAVLNARYDTVIGRTVKRQQTAWLRPMSGERHSLTVTRPPTFVEKIVALSVVVAAEALLVWFFFFAHYKLVG
jgi:hypothetical protein